MFVGNAALIARINRSSILRLVKENGPISRSEIAKRLDLNPATVGRCVAQLLQRQLLIEVGAAESRGGRRPTLLRYNHKAGSVIGLDLDGAYLLGVLADLDGEIICREYRSPSPQRDPEENLALVFDIVSSLLCNHPNHENRNIRSIGVSASSVVHNPGGIVALSAALGWRNLPLKTILEERFGYPVFVQNESDLGALAESLWGVGRNVDRLVWLHVGPGIGSGIVIHGRLYQGAHHAAGEVGYMVPDISHLSQSYETFGCMETVASFEVLLQNARRAIEAGEPSMLTEVMHLTGALSPADLFDAARRHDALATRLIDHMADHLSLIIVSIAAILDPDLIVFGQHLADALDLFLPRIEQRIRGVVPAMPRIVASALKADVIVQGAVGLALQGIDEEFYLNYPAFREALQFEES